MLFEYASLAPGPGSPISGEPELFQAAGASGFPNRELIIADKVPCPPPFGGYSCQVAPGGAIVPHRVKPGHERNSYPYRIAMPAP